VAQQQVPDDVAALLRAFTAAVPRVACVVGLYAAGSLTTGTYEPATSDLDLVAVLRRPLSRRDRRALRRLHRSLAREHPGAGRLHCCYVAARELGDPRRPHWTWAHSTLYRRPLTAFARAELHPTDVHPGGLVLHGPAPETFFGPVPSDVLRDAARDELGGYWTRAVRRPRRWRSDALVDLALLTVARAEITAREGRLVTKPEALRRLPALGVPPDLVEAVARRRRGSGPTLSRRGRRRQGRVARRLVARGIRELGPHPSRPRHAPDPQATCG
jgi:Nucleotidyltransferase domain